MGVECFIRRKSAAAHEFYSMTGATGWQAVWLPAAAELGLNLIPLLGDGTFSLVPSGLLPEVLNQLTRLREWMAVHQHGLYVEHLDDILAALARVNALEDEVSFG